MHVLLTAYTISCQVPDHPALIVACIQLCTHLVPFRTQKISTSKQTATRPDAGRYILSLKTGTHAWRRAFSNPNAAFLLLFASFFFASLLLLFIL